MRGWSRPLGVLAGPEPHHGCQRGSVCGEPGPPRLGVSWPQVVLGIGTLGWAPFRRCASTLMAPVLLRSLSRS